MERIALNHAAKLIVATNVTSNVAAASIHWDETAALLLLTYAYSTPPSEADKELAGLAMTELIAQFSDVATAEVNICLPGDIEWRNLKAELVFSKAV